MIEGISGILGVPVPRDIVSIRAFVFSETIKNCSSSFAFIGRKYSTVKHVSVEELNLNLVLLFGTEVPFITGKISI